MRHGTHVRPTAVSHDDFCASEGGCRDLCGCQPEEFIVVPQSAAVTGTPRPEFSRLGNSSSVAIPARYQGYRLSVLAGAAHMHRNRPWLRIVVTQLTPVARAPRPHRALVSQARGMRPSTCDQHDVRAAKDLARNGRGLKLRQQVRVAQLALGASAPREEVTVVGHQRAVPSYQRRAGRHDRLSASDEPGVDALGRGHALLVAVSEPPVGSKPPGPATTLLGHCHRVAKATRHVDHTRAAKSVAD